VIHAAIFSVAPTAPPSLTMTNPAPPCCLAPAHDDFTGYKPENDNDIATKSVLAPFGPAVAQMDAAA
jgi:hypothetical protein